MSELTPSVLMAAHPGHELFVSAWLRRARPAVCILSKGSGGQAGLEASTMVLAQAGARRGVVFGECCDAELRRMVEGSRLDAFDRLADQLARCIIESDARSVLCNAYERRVLTHDLCRILTGAATLRAESVLGRSIVQATFALDGYLGRAASGESRVLRRFQLDEEGLDWKLQAARSYPDPSLHKRLERLIDDNGSEGLRQERLMLASAQQSLRSDDPEPCGYQDDLEPIARAFEVTV